MKLTVLTVSFILEKLEILTHNYLKILKLEWDGINLLALFTREFFVILIIIYLQINHLFRSKHNNI